MEPTDIFAGTFTIAILIIAIFYLILSILLPVFVWLILRQARQTTKTLDHIAQRHDFAQREEEKRAAAAAYQSELIVAALQRIKDSGDGILTHAQYQTEVTKHRLALDAPPEG